MNGARCGYSKRKGREVWLTINDLVLSGLGVKKRNLKKNDMTTNKHGPPGSRQQLMHANRGAPRPPGTGKMKDVYFGLFSLGRARNVLMDEWWMMNDDWSSAVLGEYLANSALKTKRKGRGENFNAKNAVKRRGRNVVIKSDLGEYLAISALK